MSEISGPLSFASIDAWFARVDELARAERIDLAGVTHCDSAGAALLLELQRRARKNGKRLELVNAPQALRELLKFFGIDTLAGLT